uniref:hAT-like transposase RNase-H fold domain-containing protein n=1 Tax=Chenopodium quinoa TaxID=63459 RepID=A0A803ND06_CHEQI
MLMAYGMKKKHEKYWENVDNINLMLYVAVLLDPRRKMHYMKWAINEKYDSVKAAKLHDMVMTTLTLLYEHYASLQSHNVPNVSENIDLSSRGLETCYDCHDVADYELERDIGGQTDGVELTNDFKANPIFKYLVVMIVGLGLQDSLGRVYLAFKILD